MEKIALFDSENKKYPNLALMKLSAYHKQNKDIVEWFNPLKSNTYNKIYASKVFTWTKRNPYLPTKTIWGGTGFNIKTKLSENIEYLCPDYSLYNCTKSYGFLTRGCINSCPWCFVPEKEGKIRANQNIEDFTRHQEVVLMDNNVLAHEHGIKEIEKIIKLKLKVDFNQGLDARLIDNSIAKLLSKVKWNPYIRLACDSHAMIEPVRKAIELLRWYNTTPTQYFCYVLIKDIDDALERIKFLKGMNISPFCQPYRDKIGTPPTKEQKFLARFVNHKAIFKSVFWEDYKTKPRIIKKMSKIKINPIF